MDLSPEILDAMRTQYEAMGFGFNPEALSQYRTDGEGIIASAMSMGLPPQEIACRLIEQFTALHVEHELPKCVQQLGSGVLISMPLEDLRFAYGYLALAEVEVPISLDQTKRATQIAHRLAAAAADAT